MVKTYRNIQECIDDINSDSRVTLDPVELLRALEADMGARGSQPPTGRLPTPEEVEELVTGGDDGEVNANLVRMFPRTNALIESLF